MAIWFWFATPTATSPPMPMRASSWSSAATPSSAVRSLPNPVSRARWAHRNSTSRSARDHPRSIHFNSSTGRERGQGEYSCRATNIPATSCPALCQASTSRPQERSRGWPDIGERSDAVLQTAMPCHDRFLDDATRIGGYLRLDPHPQPSRQLLCELPCDPSRAGAARGRPFQRFAFKLFFGKFDAEMAAIALHHRKVFVLTATVKAEPQSEPVGE